MKAKHQRLTLVLLALAAVVGAGLLALSALKDQAAFFYSPSDLAAAGNPVGQRMRLGGMVAVGSVAKLADGVTTRFVVTDNARTVAVVYKGIVPDLFREGSGVVAEGQVAANGGFVADTILAKHDERYMPPQMAGKMHKTETLEK
ncbi:cytochrome c maturation protein CcmE [Sphingomonas donggukensis]|uniref:Cytochrome c-type biogenesis protein CcmE n=1 Tax=Sphingomonas donggukensis TaxID=2949093 RepID=A0ABY4TV52_9SPHN|nr:cytochrome c maturation protein CcmE [Sphingomonas donggukensis]URW76275.1 cytochrome c maturation protein CcmE [Sphingomonas donggukensis]